VQSTRHFQEQTGCIVSSCGQDSPIHTGNPSLLWNFSPNKVKPLFGGQQEKLPKLVLAS